MSQFGGGAPLGEARIDLVAEIEGLKADLAKAKAEIEGLKNTATTTGKAVEQGFDNVGETIKRQFSPVRALSQLLRNVVLPMAVARQVVDLAQRWNDARMELDKYRASLSQAGSDAARSLLESTRGKGSDEEEELRKVTMAVAKERQRIAEEAEVKLAEIRKRSLGRQAWDKLTGAATEKQITQEAAEAEERIIANGELTKKRVRDRFAEAAADPTALRKRAEAELAASLDGMEKVNHEERRLHDEIKALRAAARTDEQREIINDIERSVNIRLTKERQAIIDRQAAEDDARRKREYADLQSAERIARDAQRIAQAAIDGIRSQAGSFFGGDNEVLRSLTNIEDALRAIASQRGRGGRL